MQFFLLRKRLGDFNLCGLLLLFQRIQCGISIGNAVGKIADGIVQTDDVAARVIAQRYRITQLAAENDLMLILETVKANVQLKAAIGAQQHHIRIRHLLAGEHQPLTSCFFLIEHHALDRHAAEVLLILRVCVCDLGIVFQSRNTVLRFLNFLRVMLEQLIFQTIFLVLVIRAQHLELCYLHMDDLLAAIEGFAAPLQGQFVGCAISMPGRIDTRNGIAHTGGMLSAFMWEQPFAAQVEARLGVPVTIANDGKCAAAAEGWTGALAGVENGLVLVLGTGIGGGIILNGKVLMGAHAAAGEVSCLVSNMAAMEAETFELDKVESFSDAPMWAGAASATGLIREYARQKKLSLQGPLPNGEEIFAAYNAGEPEAQKALKIFARRVAVGILSLQNVLDVERVAIGGGISAAEALLPAIQAELDWLFERCTVMPTVKPELVRCRYGNDANLIGALKLFFGQNPA